MLAAHPSAIPCERWLTRRGRHKAGLLLGLPVALVYPEPNGRDKQVGHAQHEQNAGVISPGFAIGILALQTGGGGKGFLSRRAGPSPAWLKGSHEQRYHADPNETGLHHFTFSTGAILATPQGEG
jgi:hypothetical protein